MANTVHARKDGAANDRRTRTPLCRPVGHIIGGSRACWYVTSAKSREVNCKRCLEILANDPPIFDHSRSIREQVLAPEVDIYRQQIMKYLLNWSLQSHRKL